MSDSVIKVLLVDDHEVIRNGLRLLLSRAPGIEVTGEAGTAQEALHMSHNQHFNVVLLDISLLDKSGLSIIKPLVEDKPALAVLIHSLNPEEPYARYAMEHGAAGYLAKGCAAAMLIAAVRTAAAGGKYISHDIADKLANQSKPPTKENVRQWLRQRYLDPGPLPAMEQIKLELGWNYQEMCEAQTKKPLQSQTVFLD